MSKDLRKKAIDMLLNGATMLAEPCPYCKGVRVMKNGHALCVNCGKEPEISHIENNQGEEQTKSDSTLSVLEAKLEKLTKEIENEKDLNRQQEILKSINSLIEIIDKLKK